MATAQDNQLTRISVNLVPRANDALTELAQLTRLNRTDCISHALRLAAYLERITAAGGDVHVREPGNEPMLLRWI